MIYKILKTNDNNTADVELVFDEFDSYAVVISNVEIGDSQTDLENRIIDQAKVVRDELTINKNTALPYQPELNKPIDITLE